MSNIIVNPKYLSPDYSTNLLNVDSGFVDIEVPLIGGAFLVPYLIEPKGIQRVGVSLIIPDLETYFLDGKYNSSPISPHTMVFGFIPKNEITSQEDSGKVSSDVEIELLDKIKLGKRFWEGRENIPVCSREEGRNTLYHMLLNPKNFKAREFIGKASGIEDLLIEN